MRGKDKILKWKKANIRFSSFIVEAQQRFLICAEVADYLDQIMDSPHFTSRKIIPLPDLKHESYV